MYIFSRPHKLLVGQLIQFYFEKAEPKSGSIACIRSLSQFLRD